VVGYVLTYGGRRIPARSSVLIGRAEWCELRISSGSASREHAEVRLVGGDLEILDLGSLNGTTVNGERIRGLRRLRAGDVIGIGTELIQVDSVRVLSSIVADPMGLLSRAGVDGERPTHTNRDQIELIELLVEGAEASDERTHQARALCRAIDNMAAYFSRSQRMRQSTVAARQRLSRVARHVVSWFPDGDLDEWYRELVRKLDPPIRSFPPIPDA
jgi:pSer/pThr/pTyr-binding forkhead associated (FHA) protein